MTKEKSIILSMVTIILELLVIIRITESIRFLDIKYITYSNAQILIHQDKCFLFSLLFITVMFLPYILGIIWNKKLSTK